jgi:hypothetical protein
MQFCDSIRSGVQRRLSAQRDVFVQFVGDEALWTLNTANDLASPTRKHAVTAAGSNSDGYDANGNVTTRNGLSWTRASFSLGDPSPLR